jgi:hypothetical protein
MFHKVRGMFWVAELTCQEGFCCVVPSLCIASWNSRILWRIAVGFYNKPRAETFWCSTNLASFACGTDALFEESVNIVRIFKRRLIENARIQFQTHVNCDVCRPDNGDVTTKVVRVGFGLAYYLCHGNGSPDEILSICLAQESREIYP